MEDKNIHIGVVHSAIVYESRVAKNWKNACTIFKDYLVPFTNFYQRAAENPGQGFHWRVTLWDALQEDSYPRRVYEDDIRLIRWSISSLVRYAPTVSESRIMFMYLLKLKPPLRTEESINHCLGSLIYHYNQERDLEVQKQGVDFVRIALKRGLGKLDYDTSTRNTNPARNGRDTFLNSVSYRVLKANRIQISDNGLSLELWTNQPARRPQNTPTPQQSQEPQQHSVIQQRPEPQPQPELSQNRQGQPQFNQGQRVDASRFQRERETSSRPTSLQSSHQHQTQRHLMSRPQPSRWQSAPSIQKVMNENNHVGKSLVDSAQTSRDYAARTYGGREDQSARRYSVSGQPPTTGAYRGGSNDTSRNSADGSRSRQHEIGFVPESNSPVIVQALNNLSLNADVAKESVLNKDADSSTTTETTGSPFCERLNRV
ncbi:hypothetical protein BGZ65_002599 [Modicella reniformis]|uniref:Uncharacterized protein n=1 Tax=Modicella reniformis TaxID=1440133 RepID=A0A9P6SNI8_9FUNG|nr:hypothetical protein BGZ65_002599 [Modicella reniformis]